MVWLLVGIVVGVAVTAIGMFIGKKCNCDDKMSIEELRSILTEQ